MEWLPEEIRGSCLQKIKIISFYIYESYIASEIHCN